MVELGRHLPWSPGVSGCLVVVTVAALLSLWREVDATGKDDGVGTLVLSALATRGPKTDETSNVWSREQSRV